MQFNYFKENKKKEEKIVLRSIELRNKQQTNILFRKNIKKNSGNLNF